MTRVSWGHHVHIFKQIAVEGIVILIDFCLQIGTINLRPYQLIPPTLNVKSSSERKLEEKLQYEERIVQKLLRAEANRRVRMCNLQSAKDYASVKTSLAIVRARAQEMKNPISSVLDYIPKS